MPSAEIRSSLLWSSGLEGLFVTKGLTAADAPVLTNVLKSKAMARLERLWLERNALGDEGAVAVAAAGAAGLPRLKYLVLPSNQIGDAGMQALASAFAGGASRAGGAQHRLQSDWRRGPRPCSGDREARAARIGQLRLEKNEYGEGAPLPSRLWLQPAAAAAEET